MTTQAGSDLTILIVDDEESIVEVLRVSLKFQGYHVICAHDGVEALTMVKKHDPDLIVLDVMMPKMNGLEVLERLRRDNTALPVLLLTARDSVENKVEGLRQGADDYVVKPFSLEEVIARIEVLLRRNAAPPQARQDTELRFSDIVMNVDSHSVTRAGKTIELSLTEFSLLKYFLTNPNIALSKAKILQEVWNYEFDGDANVVESYVSYLRKKLEADGEKIIHTVRSVGYILRENT